MHEKGAYIIYIKITILLQPSQKLHITNTFLMDKRLCSQRCWHFQCD